MQFTNNNKKELSIDEKIKIMKQNYISDKEITCLLKSLINYKKNSFNAVVCENFMTDLEIFKLNDNTDNTDKSIFSKIDHTATYYGRFVLKNMISNPVTNMDLLLTRQKTIKNLVKNKKSLDYINNILTNMTNTEKYVLSYWKDDDTNTKALMDMIYFSNYFKSLNDNQLVLNIINIYTIYISPLSTTLLPILSILIPLVLFKLFNIPIKFGAFFTIIKNVVFNKRIFSMLSTGAKITTILSMAIYAIVYLQNVYATITCAVNTNKIINILHEKLNKVSLFIRQCTELNQYIANQNIDIKLTDISANLEELEKIFCQNSNNLFKTNPKFISNKGKILTTYTKFTKQKDNLIKLFEFVGYLDCYVSISKLYLSRTNHDNKYCFAEYYNNDKPLITMNNLWHPYLTGGNIVSNNVEIGNNKKNKKRTYNMLLTGPNASGKSTFIKSIALSILFAQTITICPSSYNKITLFNLLNTYLQINDDKGVRSSFEMEMYRCKKHINQMKQLNPHEFSFVIMDEVLTSTNYKEGIAGAYAICKKISEFKNSISIITTHYTNLTKLYKYGFGGGKSKPKKCRFTYYKFNSIIDDKTNKITYPHKLSKGISNNNIALKILENNNFDEDIVKNALDVIKYVKIPKIVRV